MDEIKTHTHNGIDSRKLNPTSFMGIPIRKSETKFTNSSNEGRQEVRWKTSDNTYYLATYVNKDWREVQIT